MDFSTYETFVIADWCQRRLVQTQPSIELQRELRVLTEDAAAVSAMALEEPVTAMLERAVRDGLLMEFDPQRSVLVTALVNKCLRRVNWAQVAAVITDCRREYHAVTLTRQWQ